MRRMLTIALSLLLAACYTSGKRGSEVPMAIHDFGAPSGRVVEPGLASTVALEVRAPLWVDGLGLGYRLVYADPTRRHDYTRTRWAGAPSQMIQQRLAVGLGLSQVGVGRTSCVLRIEIAEFSQVFLAPGQSQGVFSGRLQWLDRQRREQATRPFQIEVPARTPDADGGVRALIDAVDRLQAKVLAWRSPSGGDLVITACLP